MPSKSNSPNYTWLIRVVKKNIAKMPGCAILMPMFAKIRQKDIKKMLWVLVGIIIPAFVLWGGISYLSQSQGYALKVYNKKISLPQFYSLLKNYRVFIKAKYGSDALSRLPLDNLKIMAIQHLLFLEKAKREKIKVKDSQLLKEIMSLPVFYSRGKFDQNKYKDFLRSVQTPAGQFEDFLKERIMAEILLKKHTAGIKVSDEETLRLYKELNEQAKIDYIPFLYKEIKKQIQAGSKELKDYYKTHKEDFRIPQKVQIKYLKLPLTAKKALLAKMQKLAKRNYPLAKIARVINVKIETSGFFAFTEPIKGLGFSRQFNLAVFNSPPGKTSGPVNIDNYRVVFSKIKENPSYIPKFNEIIDHVKNTVVKNKARQTALSKAKSILSVVKKKKIKELINLKKIMPGIEVKHSKFFKRGQFVEDMGLNPVIYKNIFSLKKGQILPRPLLLDKGVFVIQLVDFKPIDKKKYQAQKKILRQKIRNLKYNRAEQKFLQKIIKESKFTYSSTLMALTGH